MKQDHSTKIEQAHFFKKKFESDLKWEFLQYIETLKAIDDTSLTTSKIITNLRSAIKSLPTSLALAGDKEAQQGRSKT